MQYVVLVNLALILARASCASVFSRIGPLRLVVRSKSSSCKSTASPSFVSATSNSIKSAPSVFACATENRWSISSLRWFEAGTVGGRLPVWIRPFRSLETMSELHDGRRCGSRRKTCAPRRVEILIRFVVFYCHIQHMPDINGISSRSWCERENLWLHYTKKLGRKSAASEEQKTRLIAKAGYLLGQELHRLKTFTILSPPFPYSLKSLCRFSDSPCRPMQRFLSSPLDIPNYVWRIDPSARLITNVATDFVLCSPSSSVVAQSREVPPNPRFLVRISV